MKHRSGVRALGHTKIVIGLAAATLALTSCASTSPEPGGSSEDEDSAESQSAEITLIANEAFANSWRDEMLPEFNKHFPDIKVTIDGVPYTELLAKTMLDATSATPEYDIIVGDDNWLPQIADAGALLDLKSDEIASITSEDYDWDDFNAGPLASGEWEGVQYGVPLRSNLLLMFVNETLYEEAGVPLPTPDLTWEEYLEQAPQLVQDTNGDGKIDAWAVDTYFMREPLTPTIWQTILNSNGGEIIVDGEVAFNNQDGIDALQTHIDLLQWAPPGSVSHGFDESLASFRAGQVATSFNWGSVYKGSVVSPETTTLSPENATVQVMPVGSNSA